MNIFGKDEERIKRGEAFYNEFLPEYMRWQNGESEEIQIDRNADVCAKDKEPSKKSRYGIYLAIGTVGLLLCSQCMTKSLENNEYGRTDKSDAIIMEIPDEVDITKYERNATKKAFLAERICSDRESNDEQIAKAENEIYEYMISGIGKNVAESIVKAKIKQAKTYGSYMLFKERDGITYVNNSSTYYRKENVSGMQGGMQEFDYQLLSKKLPPNLDALVDDIVDCDECNERKEWIKTGKQLLKDEETVMCEYYLLDISGNLKEVDKKSFDKKKEQYEKEISKIQYKASISDNYDFLEH